MSVGVTAPAGFRAAGVAAGIKPSGRLDLALVASNRTIPTAAVFTTSHAAAAPVTISRRRVRSGSARAVLLNSGCANAATGDSGIAATVATTGVVAAALGCPPDDVLAASTGPIGVPLNAGAIAVAVPGLVAGLGNSAGHATQAAEAIMTTDTVPKTAVTSGRGFVVGGMAKGAGMIRPDMATMLSVLTTDAAVTARSLATVLREAVASTFNLLNVDGCQSTNDTVVLMASGAAQTSPSIDDLGAAVESVCRTLTLQMAHDAEGASKVVHVRVVGAETDGKARRLGLAVTDSALVRASFFGADPNWGRVFAALGTAGVTIDQSMVDIIYAGVAVCRSGVETPVDADDLGERLGGDFDVEIRVGQGSGAADMVTTDLTPDYVRFNAAPS